MTGKDGTERKELGKIASAFFGVDERQRMGLHIMFHFGGSSNIGHTEACFWDYGREVDDEAGRGRDVVEAMRQLSTRLKEAGVDRAGRLEGLPVEITLGSYSGPVVGWRILTEVL